VRLRDLVTGDLTHRELIAYIKHLPMEGAVGRVVLGDAAAWTPEMHRLTDIADLLSFGHYIAATVAGGKAKRPKPIKRPPVPSIDL
jgi:hypothetical protein